MGKVKFHRENGTSIITLNRPDRYNALDFDTLDQLYDTLIEVKNNEDPVVIITGEGKAFCSGGDITMMTEMDESNFDQFMNLIENITTTLYLLPKIVIVAVNGSAAGLGMSLALNSDYIVANDRAKFGMLFAGIGLFPDGGGHFFLKERIGTHRAKQFIWSMEQIEGLKAKELGIVDIVTEEDAKTEAKLLAFKILQSPLKAIIQTKLVFHESQKDDLIEYLRKEKIGQLKLAKTKDHLEGIQAFLEKRKPTFFGE